MASLDPYLEQIPKTLSGGGGTTGIPAPTNPRTTGGPYPPIPSTTNLQTGGPNPPVPVVTRQTGGPNPPVPVTGTQTPPMLPSGGGTPPTPVGPSLPTLPSGGGYPPVPVGGGLTLPGGEDGRVPVTPTATPAGNFGPAQTVNDMLNSFLNGQYAQNARRRGLEQASARGLLNSSIAAGASQRAALEAVQPFVSEGMNLLGQRENRAFQAQESLLDRQFRSQLQSDSVLQQEWLNRQNFNNQFNAQLSMLPINNSLQMLQYIMQAGLNDPEVFTPQIMSGLGNFFNNNMLTLLQQYFPQNFPQQTNTGGA